MYRSAMYKTWTNETIQQSLSAIFFVYRVFKKKVAYINKIICVLIYVLAILSEGNLRDENAVQYSFLISLYVIALLFREFYYVILFIWIFQEVEGGVQTHP